MVRHMVFWKYKDEFTEAENKGNGLKIKEALEPLKEEIPGVVSLKVITEPLPTGSGDADIILDSVFENEEALKNYQVHPEHVKAGAFIGSVTKDRKCIDYKED